MGKILIIVLVIGILVFLIAGYFIIFHDGKDNPIKPSGNVTNINNLKIGINGEESKQIEIKCNSDLIKCTKTGCKQVC